MYEFAMNETKPYQRFRSKMEYIDQHLEAVDAGLTTLQNAASAAIPKSLTIAQMLGESDKYTTLNNPVTDANRVIAYSKAVNIEYAIVFLHRCFSLYLKSLLAELYITNPYQVTGLASPKRSISFPEIVKFGSYEKIAEHMVDKAFRDLENSRTTKGLLEKILEQFNFNVETALIQDALMYFEIRHLIIHNDCNADEKFVDDFGTRISIKVGDKIPRNFRLAESAKSSIIALAKAIDDEVVNLLIASNQE